MNNKLSLMNTSNNKSSNNKSSNSTLNKESYLLWIHCNKCFENYMSKQRHLLLLACQHVLCEDCLKSMDASKDVVCLICSKTVRMRELGNSLPPHIKQLFHPHPWQRGLTTNRVGSFQRPHRENLRRHMNHETNHYNKMKERYKELHARTKEEFELLDNKRCERKHLESRIRKIIKMRREKKSPPLANAIIHTSIGTDQSIDASNNASKIRELSSLRSHSKAPPPPPPSSVVVRPNSAPSFLNFTFVDNSFNL